MHRQTNNSLFILEQVPLHKNVPKLLSPWSYILLFFVGYYYRLSIGLVFILHSYLWHFRDGLLWIESSASPQESLIIVKLKRRKSWKFALPRNKGAFGRFVILLNWVYLSSSISRDYGFGFVGKKTWRATSFIEVHVWRRYSYRGVKIP